MKPRTPDRTGFADNDGVGLHYEVHGEGESGVPLLFLSAFCIIDARLWNMQIPHFARHHPCVAYDPPGAGASDRPTDVSRFTVQARVADALAVMDDAGLAEAVVVGISQGGLTAPLLAVTAPERVLGVVMIAPTIPLGDVQPPGRDTAQWDRWWRLEAITGEFEGFLKFFYEEVFSEPFSSIGVEDAIEWGSRRPRNRWCLTCGEAAPKRSAIPTATDGCWSRWPARPWSSTVTTTMCRPRPVGRRRRCSVSTRS